MYTDRKLPVNLKAVTGTLTISNNLEGEFNTTYYLEADGSYGFHITSDKGHDRRIHLSTLETAIEYLSEYIRQDRDKYLRHIEKTIGKMVEVGGYKGGAHYQENEPEYYELKLAYEFKYNAGVKKEDGTTCRYS